MKGRDPHLNIYSTSIEATTEKPAEPGELQSLHSLMGAGRPHETVSADGMLVEAWIKRMGKEVGQSLSSQMYLRWIEMRGSRATEPTLADVTEELLQVLAYGCTRIHRRLGDLAKDAEEVARYQLVNEDFLPA